MNFDSEEIVQVIKKIDNDKEQVREFYKKDTKETNLFGQIIYVPNKNIIPIRTYIRDIKNFKQNNELSLNKLSELNELKNEKMETKLEDKIDIKMIDKEVKELEKNQINIISELEINENLKRKNNELSLIEQQPNKIRIIEKPLINVSEEKLVINDPFHFSEEEKQKRRDILKTPAQYKDTKLKTALTSKQTNETVEVRYLDFAYMTEELYKIYETGWEWSYKIQTQNIPIPNMKVMAIVILKVNIYDQIGGGPKTLVGIAMSDKITDYKGLETTAFRRACKKLGTHFIWEPKK